MLLSGIQIPAYNFRVVLGRRGFAFLDSSMAARKGLTFSQRRQRRYCIRRFIFTFVGVICFHQRPPTGVHNRAAFCAEAMPGTFQRYRRFHILMRLCDGTEQAQSDQFQHSTLSARKASERGSLKIGSGNDGVVIGHLFVVDDLRGVYMDGKVGHLRQRRCHAAYECGQAIRHFRGQITAVGAGIGAELLFIQALEIIQCPLGGEAKNSVGITLQGGEIVKGRRFFGLALVLQLCDHSALIGAGLAQSLGIRFTFHAYTASIKA